jgi:hypothetical protein
MRADPINERQLCICNGIYVELLLCVSAIVLKLVHAHIPQAHVGHINSSLRIRVELYQLALHAAFERVEGTWQECQPLSFVGRHVHVRAVVRGWYIREI